MNSLPSKLSRKAIAKIFDKLTPTAWERLFARENENGLAKIRGEGDFQKLAYYTTDGLTHWLVRNGFYTPEELHQKTDAPYAPITGTISTVRTHLLSH